MAVGEKEPRPASRAQLARELRRARESRPMSGRELAQYLQISQSKISRIESGLTVPTTSEVFAWANASGVSDEHREWLVSLADSVYTEVHSWPEVLRMRAHIQDEIEERELHARAVRVFQPSVVPGLLQTAEYARRTISMGYKSKSVDDVTETLAGRLRRQLVVYEEDRQFDFVITEAALRWRPGPGPAKLMLGQLDRITSVSTLDNVSIGVIPLDAPAITFNTHAFVLYDHPDDEGDPFVEVEAIHANMIINETTHVALYQERWLQLSEMALFGDEARAVLAERTETLRAE